MYIFKNALRNILRSYGRNILIGIIVLVIAASSCIAISIRRSAEKAREDSLKNMSITASIRVDRAYVMTAMKEASSESSDVKTMQELMAEYSTIKLEKMQEYAEEKCVDDFYYVLKAAIDGNDDLKPVSSDTSTTEESSSDSSSSESSASDSSTTEQMPGQQQMPGGPGGEQGQMPGQMQQQDPGQMLREQGDFMLSGYSSEKAMTDFTTGVAQVTKGEMFEEGTENYDCVISEELSLMQDEEIKVDDVITVVNPNAEDQTFELKVVGIYKNSNSSESATGGTSNDEANNILMSYTAVKAICDACENYVPSEDSGSDSDKDSGKESSSESSKETSKESSSESSKESSSESSKQTSTESSKQTSTESSKQTSTESSKQTSTESSKQTSTESSKQTSTESSKQTSTDTSKQTSAGLTTMLTGTKTSSTGTQTKAMAAETSSQSSSESSTESSSDKDSSDEEETMDYSLATNVVGSYVLKSIEDYDTLEAIVKERDGGRYVVTSSEVASFESSLIPLDNLKSFAGTFLLIILLIGAIILIVLHLYNVRERKYEIGVLLSMGMNKFKVGLQFVLEIFLVTLTCILIGTLVGAATSVPVTDSLLAAQVSSQESQDTQTNANFGRPGAMTRGGDVEGDVTYISDVSYSVDGGVILQMVLIGIILTLVSSGIAVLFVMRYQPLKILTNRD